MAFYLQNTNMGEMRHITFGIKSLIREKPGLTNEQITNMLPNNYPNRLVRNVMRLMRNNGTIITRDGKYYVLDHSIRAKAKRQRQKQRERLQLLRRIRVHI